MSARPLITSISRTLAVRASPTTNAVRPLIRHLTTASRTIPATHSIITRRSPSFLPATNSPYRRHLSTEVRSAIESAISSAPVVLFMKGTPETPQCGFSRATIQILGLQGVDPAKFHAFNVLDDPKLRDGVKEFSDWPTIPQLYVGGEFIGGCDIVVSMHQKGELATLLGEKGVLALEEEEKEEETKK